VIRFSLEGQNSVCPPTGLGRVIWPESIENTLLSFSCRHRVDIEKPEKNRGQTTFSACCAAENVVCPRFFSVFLSFPEIRNRYFQQPFVYPDFFQNIPDFLITGRRRANTNGPQRICTTGKRSLNNLYRVVRQPMNHAFMKKKGVEGGHVIRRKFAIPFLGQQI
jgi:hypothetical protein